MLPFPSHLKRVKVPGPSYERKMTNMKKNEPLVLNRQNWTERNLTRERC